MTLPHVRTVQYLSPSALKLLEEKPAEFYFRRLGPPELAPPREEQNYPAAVGIAFDAMVKARVAKEKLIRCPSLEFMLNEVKTDREDVLKHAEQLLAGYERSGALRRLLEERPMAVAVDGEDFAPGTKVPVRTRIDCVIDFRGMCRILDWKVRGSNNPGSMSPTPGYMCIWDTDQPGIPLGAHPKHVLPLEELNRDWATQIVIYGWAQGYPLTNDLVGCIDEVVAWHGDRVRVASFRHNISLAFQQGVKQRLEDAWRRIESREVLDPRLTIDEARVLM